MKRAMTLAVPAGALLAGLFIAGSASAYEFKLQFGLPSNARAVRIAGFAFASGKVAGDCSFDTVTSGSGRDPRSYTTHYYQKCTWDLKGNLLSVLPGEPPAPAPISSVGGLTIYANDGKGDTAGTDTAVGGGFVNHPSAQYSWLTPGGGYVFRSDQAKFDISLILQNVGDLPLAINKFTPTSSYAKMTVKSATCSKLAPVAPGGTCTVVITYDPSAVPGGDNPYTAYDHISVGVTSNSGFAPLFSETVEVYIAPGG